MMRLLQHGLDTAIVFLCVFEQYDAKVKAGEQMITEIWPK